jgi:putative membrane protein
MMNGMMGGTSMMGMGLMMMIGLFFLVIIIGVAIYIFIRIFMGNSQLADHPLMILKERYVKGEISEEEYEEKRKVLNRK